ncbi:Cytoplasmic and mitochondrial histidine tRNA synthetase [Pleurotus ostreatus]|nr:Cytoplasmic and mitochondrial histidine tRNA synthetase [Pleurotus ostreatus]
MSWVNVKKEMTDEKGLDSVVADKIGEYVKLKGGLDLLEKLEADTTLMANPNAKQGVAEMKILFGLLKAYKVIDKLSFDLSLARGLDYYTRLIYEAVTEASAPPGFNAANVSAPAPAAPIPALLLDIVSPAKPATTTAKALKPFDDEDADIILRSSDGVDFYVYKLILTLASPIFRDMFLLPDSASNAREGDKALVDMHENSDVLDTLLRLCYPTTVPKVLAKKLFYDVISAATKFQMQLYEKIVSLYVDEAVLGESPLEFYILAQRFGLRELARDSARKCLGLSLDAIITQGAANLELISGRDYNRILRYHRRCSEGCLLLFRCGFSWLPKESPSTDYPFRRHPASHLADGTCKLWWLNHTRRIELAFTANSPGPLSVVKAIDINATQTEVIATVCRTCRDAATEDIYNFTIALEKQVNIEIDKIELELDI